MSILTRSATMPYATTDAAALISAARRLLLNPLQIGSIRLLGVGFSGLTEVHQEPLFASPELEPAAAPQISQADQPADSPAVPPMPGDAAWRIGDDVTHRAFGHGWVQGAGHGVVTVRFETRATGPGRARTFPVDTPEITGADPVDSLDWPDYIGASAADEGQPDGVE
jgi:DNA polymerase-4